MLIQKRPQFIRNVLPRLFWRFYDHRPATCLQSTVISRSKSSETPLVRQLRAKIQATGPLTVSDYMREVLLHPVHGYYIHKDAIGQRGDFTTSPEISQVFGELMAVWFVDQWFKMGRPSQCQIVELGPGRGTLASDILRVLSKLPMLDPAGFSLHLVEVSPHFRRLQQEKLCVAKSSQNKTEDSISAVTKFADIPVTWYSDLKEVPRAFSLIVAHEFLDALPVHKFHKTDKGWREVLVDVDDSPDGPHHFRFVLARAPTPASLAYVTSTESRDQAEISPAGGVVALELASRIEEEGGCALIVDYGHHGDKTDTFRAFKSHCQFDPLCEPGTADLTADVDFKYLAGVLREKALTFGPVSQGEFLKNMGIELRMDHLLRTCPVHQRNDVRSAYDMLVNPEKMGERFKMFAVYPLVMEPILTKFPPSGFTLV